MTGAPPGGRRAVAYNSTSLRATALRTLHSRAHKTGEWGGWVVVPFFRCGFEDHHPLYPPQRPERAGVMSTREGDSLHGLPILGEAL